MGFRIEARCQVPQGFNAFTRVFPFWEASSIPDSHKALPWHRDTVLRKTHLLKLSGSQANIG